MASLQASRGSAEYLIRWEFKNAEYDVEKLKDNSEPEEDRGIERRLAVDENSSRRTCA
jgi:hypothetical protein